MRARLTARLMLPALALALTTAPLAAQDSAEVDAVADVVRASDTASVTGALNLDFGTIAIPRESAATCLYQVNPSGGSGVSLRVEQTGGPSGGSVSNPTPDGCSISGTQTTAEFFISCQQAGPVLVQPTLQVPANQGVRMERLTGMSIVAPNGTIQTFDPGNIGGGAPLNCPATPGDFRVRLGGEASVRGFDQPQPNLNIGRVRIDLNY
ncbi:hypothetical protein CHX26_01110 [Porphyrobacter sp. HT-58-2]|uniref:hypothetical protein n=1 Tax=Porphyrobacter sp. HT-58-2 TaxID=2023229 RepID=UPI000CDCB16B|nr:hypothetical protein [Porphyrobacter sp. HT-58-2]AUX68301.1 hypothetical protein CHX26_01110 [Porphyrobacter sp. HT-58-2]